MWKLFVAVVLVAITGAADNAKSAEDKKEKLLKVGDPVPALKASKWLQDEEVKDFQPDKVYVIEFWATWCGLCIHFMPHTAELQAQYADQGVTFICYTAADPDNTEEKVAAFIKKRGPKLRFTFAYADDRTTYDAWMTAARREGIPCVFVVDKTGRIAYIGHPLYLAVVLARVVAGNMNAQTVSDEVRKIDEEHHDLAVAEVHVQTVRQPPHQRVRTRACSRVQSTAGSPANHSLQRTKKRGHSSFSMNIPCVGATGFEPATS